MPIKSSAILIAASTLALAACAGEESATNAMNDMAAENAAAVAVPEQDNDMANASLARAMLAAADGSARGEATVTETPEGLRVEVSGLGLPAGVHGVHIHMTGRCDAPGFESAGGHWNPTNKQHGRDNPQGHHAGDLPNLTIAPDGTGSLIFSVSDGRLSGGDGALLDADGAAIVVHADADDLRTDPSGNSGGRIACGVLGVG